MRSCGFARRLSARESADDVNIHDNRNDIRNAAGREFGMSPYCRVIDTAGELDDSVMYFDADGVLHDIPVTVQLSKDLLLNLPVVFHRIVLSQDSLSE